MQKTLEYQLIKKAIKGDHQAFEQLIQPYESKVYNIALQMFKNREDAYDGAQEVLIKVYRNLNKFKFESAFSTWLHRLAVNTCIDDYRKRQRHREHMTSMEIKDQNKETWLRELPDPRKTPEESVLQQETVTEVHQALSQLKDQQKLILIYREIQGYSYAEIGDILTCSQGTVKSRLSRARQALKEIILKNREQIGVP